MGSGSPGCSVLVRTWVKENVVGALALAVIFSLAVLYAKFCYMEPDEEIMRWIKKQTVNDGNTTEMMITRLPSKYRMLNPFLLFVDYPLCRFVTFDLKLKDVPGVSANLVSLVHPLVAVLASITIIRAAYPPRSRPDSESTELPLVTKDSSQSLVVPAEPNFFLVKLAAFLFTLRNTLDTLDGVLARAQQSKTLSTKVGFNGHLLDVVTDMAGVTCFGVCIWYHFYLLKSRVERHSFPGVREAVSKLISMGLSPVAVSRIMVFGGLAMIGMTGMSWETTMLKMQIFFDETSNPAIQAVERTPPVQICYLLWSLTCSDTLFTYLTVALMCGVAHDWLLILAVYGWSWLVILTLYSVYTTRWIGNLPELQGAL